MIDWLKAKAAAVLGIGAGLLLLVLVGLLGTQTFRLTNARADLATEQLGRSQDRVIGFAVAESASTEARLEGVRRYDELQEILNAERSKTEAARADAAVAAGAADKLRRYTATLAARCDRPAVDTSAGGGSAPAASTGDLLADMQRRLDEAAGGIGKYADDTSIAGDTCERQYDSLETKLKNAASNPD